MKLESPAHLLGVNPSSPASSQLAQPRSSDGRFGVTARTAPELPVVVCARCDGVGMHGSNSVDGDRCYGCGGTGHQYAPEVKRDVVAKFASAQRAAARPQVRQLKVGDSISRTYTQLADAHFKQVARILVAPQRPTRFEGRGAARRPVAFAAVVDFTDGSRDVVTTDAVYARRGAIVDPAPFVKLAARRCA
jgi:hypothetical protein